MQHCPSQVFASFAALDFDIVKSPTIAADAITFDVLGQILPSPSSPLYPMMPNSLPDVIRGSMVRPPASSRLHSRHLSLSPPLSFQVEVIFDQMLLNSAFATVYSARLLAYVITPLQFPKLNTSNFCFFNPSLCQQFPNDGIVLTLDALEAPLISITSAGVAIAVNTSLNFAANSSAGAGETSQPENTCQLFFFTLCCPGANSSAGVLSPFLNLSCSLSLAAALALGNNASGAPTARISQRT